MSSNLHKSLFLRLLLSVVFSIPVLFLSCSNSPTDMRSLVSDQTLIYLESNDFAQMLKLITENEKFKKDSALIPDLSALEGLQIAISVTGFDTSEKQVTNESSILNLKPKFVAVAETHGWSWQVEGLVDGPLNKFVKRAYGEDVKVERKSLTNSDWYIWTTIDGRRSFAAIAGTRVYFANDEDSLEKALSAGRGDSESLLGNNTVDSEYGRSKGKLAFGFASNEGIKKIADVFGISVAVEQTEDEKSRGFISRILPQILNNSVKEIVWTAEKTGNGVVDEIFVKTNPETSAILTETIVSSSARNKEMFSFLPAETRIVTRYDLKNPQVAFRSILLVTARSVSEADASLIAAFSNSLLEPYGITNAEEFLSGVDSQIVTAQIDEEGDNSFAVLEIKDFEKVRSALSNELDLNDEFKQIGIARLWTSANEDLAAATIDTILLLGNIDAVSKALTTWNRRKLSPAEVEKDFTKGKLFDLLHKSNAVSVTFGRGNEDIGRLVSVLGEVKKNEERSFSNTVVETRFTKSGIERRSTSDFGFIGIIIAQFEDQ